MGQRGRPVGLVNVVPKVTAVTSAAGVEVVLELFKDAVAGGQYLFPLSTSHEVSLENSQ